MPALVAVHTLRHRACNPAPQMAGYPLVGVAEIDQEHAAFEGLLRTLLAAAQDKDTARGAAFFGALLVRARGHFAREGRPMLEVSFPAAGIARHAATHRGFLRQVDASHRELCEEGFTVAVTAFIKDTLVWFEPHVGEGGMPPG